MMGICAAHEEKINSRKRDARLNELTSRWSIEEKQALQILQGVMDKFVQAHGRNEVDHSGTGRAAFEIEEEAALRDDFITALERFEKGQLPHFTSAQFRQADADLNDVYSKIRHTKDLDRGDVTVEQIQATQRLWLPYREAWVAFGKKKYPAVSADSWRAWLTQQRADMLNERHLN